MLWSLMVNTLTFAVLSKRPAILVSILPAAIHALDLQLNNPADAGRAEVCSLLQLPLERMC